MAALVDQVAKAEATVDEDSGPAYLWPESEPAWSAFVELQDQWCEGVLPRSEILAHLHEVCPDPELRRDVYTGVCVCVKATRAVHADVQREHKRRAAAQRG